MSEKNGHDRYACRPEACGHLLLKKIACKWIAQRQCARKTSTPKTRENSSAQSDRCASPGPTLIDSLEQRLLYSADHPLGLGVIAADLHNELTQLDDAQLVSDTLEVLHQQRLNDSDTQPLLQDRNLVQNEIVVTTGFDSIDATDMSSFANFNGATSGDGEVSLREAIQVANADSSVSSIFLPNGEYRLTLDNFDPTEDRNQEGDFDLLGTFVIQGESREGTIIKQGLEDRRVFEVRSGDVSFADLTISGDGLTGNLGFSGFLCRAKHRQASTM